MKKTLTLLALATGLLVIAPSEAKADCRRFVGYDRCGNQVFEISWFAGYDHCGRPVYRTRTEVVSCRPRACEEGPRYSSGWGGYRPSCDDGRRFSAGYSSGGGFRLSFGFGDRGRCR